MEFAALAAFRKLYKYITGSNENGEKMDMTSPVVLKIKKTWSFWWSNVYTLSFLLPSAYQKNPPKPTNSEVYFTDMPEMNVYVRSFRGWMFSWVMHSHSKQLKEDLEKAKATHEECYFAVGYNSPMTILNRHNEIWYQAIGEPVCVLPGK
ncbi:hypothetical protein GJAV_G00220190 [Gymnothorax javanicus]|nr:hypothetical protein GJAV_G00220190 [Gymnothorax javanicus]